MRVAVAVVILLASLPFAPSALARECRVETPEEDLARASTAFVGRVVESTTGEPREVSFRVSERFKGAEAMENVRVSVPISIAKSLPDFLVNASFLVFAENGNDGILVLKECSGTTETSVPAVFDTAPAETRTAYSRDVAVMLDRVRAARPLPQSKAMASNHQVAGQCPSATPCPEAVEGVAREGGPHFGGLHLLGGLGVGTERGEELRSALEAGAMLSFGPRAHASRDGWSYGTSQGLVVGLAWAQSLERLRGEAYGEVGWAVASGYGGLLFVGGPSVRLFRDQAFGLSARACGWAMALELCLRATGTFVEQQDASALVLVGFGVN